MAVSPSAGVARLKETHPEIADLIMVCGELFGETEVSLEVEKLRGKAQ